MNLKKAVAVTCKGDKKGMQFLYENYKNKIYFSCLLMINNENRAKAAVKKIFERVFLSMTKNAKCDNFEELLYDELAKVCKSGAIENETNHIDNHSLLSNSSLFNTADDIKPEHKDIFLDAIKNITVNQRIAFVLNMLFEYQPKRIAQLLKFPEGKATTTIDNAKDNIKKYLSSNISNLSKKDLILFMTSSKNILEEKSDNETAPSSVNEKVNAVIDTFAKPQPVNTKKIVIIAAIAIVVIVGIIAGIGIVDHNKKPSVNPSSISSDGTFSADTISGKHHAEIEIVDYGKISLELDADTAPITVANFLNLANQKFYDNLTFHRIIADFMIQGGDPSGDGTGGSDQEIKGEFSNNGVENNISHKRGVISMARAMDMDSASSQFFIVHKDSPHLDGQYAAFGKVTSGMEVVDAICEKVTNVDSNGMVQEESDKPVIKTITVID